MGVILVKIMIMPQKFDIQMGEGEAEGQWRLYFS